MRPPLTSAAVGFSLSLVSVLVNANAALARPVYEHYYVGLDGRQTLTTGTYTGLNNPNFNRLTFLYPHIEPDPSTNHFHGIGTYSYTGSAANPTVMATSANNRIPEAWTGLAPLTLEEGTGVFANRLISQVKDEEYTNWQIKPLASLLDHGSEPATQFLYNSSGGRWQASLGQSLLALELVSLSPGLGIADAQGADLFSFIGDRHSLGQGDNFAFTPVFYTFSNAPSGNYSASFRLVDLSNQLQPSGEFFVDLQVAAVAEGSFVWGLGVVVALGLWTKYPRS